MFDIQAVKRELGIECENIEFETQNRAKDAKCANPEQKVSKVNAISTPNGSTIEISEIENRLEAVEERAAIMEFDGGLPRKVAEKYAVNIHLRSFIFTTTDGEGTYLGRVRTIKEAWEALELRFGEKLIRVTHNHLNTIKKVH